MFIVNESLIIIVLLNLQPTEGNRVKDYGNDDDLYTERDGDDIANFRDADRSVTRTDVCSEAVTVVRPEPFHMTPECYKRTGWNMAWCCQNFGEVYLRQSVLYQCKY